LDKELEKRGHRYVRYADAFSVYTKSMKAARRVGNSIFMVLKNKAKLPIHQVEKGHTKIFTIKLPGYQFVPSYKKRDKGIIN
jgi:RNA-directed DNA polymerase